MATATATGTPPPNFRTTRLLGVFQIVFASCLLILGLCMGGYMMMLPMFSNLMVNAQQTIQKQAEERKKADLDALAQRAKTAETDQEKAEVEAERKEIEDRPKGELPATMDFNKMGLNDPTLIGWCWTEIVTGLVLNVAMFVSGIGLLGYKPWARKLGVWTSLLKIVRLVLVYGFFVLSVVPTFSQKMGVMVSEMMTQQQKSMGRSGPAAAMPPETFAKVYTVMYSAMGTGWMLVGSVYPAVALWFLSRPRVRAACESMLKPGAGLTEL